jgi:hypothetical protein
MITASALPVAPVRGRLIALWILSGFAGLLFIGVGGAKLAGAAPAASLVPFVLTGIIAYLRKS